MSFGVSVEKDFDLTRVKFDMSKQINMVAGAIIKDHKNRLTYGQDVNEKPMEKLSGSTIQSKRARKMKKPRIPLYGKGVMLKVYSKQSATKNNPVNIIIPPKKREKVAVYHQKGTRPYKIKPKKAKRLGPLFTPRGDIYFAKQVNHPGLPKREWFGVTKTQEKKGVKLMELEIERILRDA